jgi:hypothetical protein
MRLCRVVICPNGRHSVVSEKAQWRTTYTAMPGDYADDQELVPQGRSGIYYFDPNKITHEDAFVELKAAMLAEHEGHRKKLETELAFLQDATEKLRKLAPPRRRK